MSSSLWSPTWPVSFSFPSLVWHRVLCYVEIDTEGRYRFHLPAGGKILFQNASTYPSLSEFLPPLQPQKLVNFISLWIDHSWGLLFVEGISWIAEFWIWLRNRIMLYYVRRKKSPGSKPSTTPSSYNASPSTLLSVFPSNHLAILFAGILLW